MDVLFEDANAFRKGDLACCGLLLTHNDAHQCRFASAIWSGKAIAVASVERDADILKRTRVP